MSTHASARRALIGTLAAGLVATPLALGFTVAPALADPAGSALVISEVYGGGGNSSATYTHDYVEIFNPTSTAKPLSGMSVQYRSTASTAAPAAGGVTSLAGAPDLAPGDFFVVQLASQAPVGAAVPNVDLLGNSSTNLSGSNGQVYLASSNSAIDPDGAGNTAITDPAVVDFIGYGTASIKEGAGAAPAPTGNTVVLSRTANGADTDVNSADFAVENPTPGAASPRTGEPVPVPDAVARTIPEIQGTGAASAFDGTRAIVEGVVTAAYPSGGLFGFYIQTPGTGGPTDPATRTASDGLFVRQAAGTVGVTPGQTVRVTGEVDEFAGQTQVQAATAADVVVIAAAAPVTPTTTATWPATDALKERLEGMLFRPAGSFTVSNNFTTNQFGELGLAVGSKPLIQPTEVARPGTPAAAAVAADNAARAIVLDDGSSTNFTQTAETDAACGTRPQPCLVNGNQTPPYISNSSPIRTGATGTFTQDVILTQGGSTSSPTYRFQPLTRVVGDGSGTAPITVPDTRTAAPVESQISSTGTADLKIAGFNVLNYFTTLGDADDDNVGDGGCSAFTDRTGDGVTVNSGCDQRGAWDPQDFTRQQTKIVKAINALDADVVGLIEIETSARLGETPDEATNSLVAALNADAGAGTWAANPSSADLPPAADRDVINNAIIYKPAAVSRLGAARALGDQSTGNGTASDEAFANAREPIAQAFTPAGGGDPFMVVVNHFKSKGSAGPYANDTDQGDGQGAGNQSRIRQATALRDWLPTVQGDVDDVVMLGDYNSYSQEDPLQVLYTAGFTNLAPEGDYSYSFQGLSGSLDHALANASAAARVTGTDVWNINGEEPIPLEYSRFNYHSTDFYAPTPFRSSDHDPVVIGLQAEDVEPATRTIQILGTNDFHGRLLNNAAGAPGSTTGTPAGPNTSVDQQAGAAILSGAVKQLRGQNPDTVFAAAGDLIGASTFESFIQNDEPTIDALNAAGLQVSAAGNHEFDQGYEDLVGRVQARANWEYLAANIEEPAGRDELAESWTQDFGDVKVGFVGAVTEDLPSLVSPAGIEGVTVTDIVAATNREADALDAAGADLIVLLVHEGASSTDCASMDDDPTSAFGSIITGVNDKVDAIVSGHTHLAYNCSFPVAGWADRAVKDRPVVSAGQYGTNLNQLKFTVATATGAVQAKTQALLPLKAATTPFAANYPSDPAVEPIVADAITKAGPLGNVPVGTIEAPFSRAKFTGGSRENRGGESTLGNLVAEIQRWATRNPESGSAQIALMNPGGLRADLVGTAANGSRAVTYREAANVQPFANTLVNMDLTGSQLETVLEQQWQTTTTGSVPSRPFLKLGQSEGFEYTYYTYSTPRTDNPSLTRTAGEVTSMKLNGVEIVPTQVYSVTVNSFLASGGDNFRELANGTSRQDTGKADLQAQVDYFEQVVGDTPLEVDYSQRAVGVAFPGQDNTVTAGEAITFDLTSLIMTGAAGGVTDLKDAAVDVSINGAELGTFPVDTSVPDPGTATGEADAASTDESGKATVTVTIPRDLAPGKVDLQISGETTGTELLVPIIVESGAPVPPAPGQQAGTTVSGTASSVEVGKPAAVTVTVDAVGSDAVPTGTVRLLDGSREIGTGALGTGGTTTITVPASELEVGTNVFTLAYGGGADYLPSSGSVTITVTDRDPDPDPDPDPTPDPDPEPELASPSITVRHTPGKVVADRTRPQLVVVVRSAGDRATGWVQVRVAGETYVRKLVNGRLALRLPAFGKPGVKTVFVKYGGDKTTESRTVTHAIRVVRR